MTLTYNTQSLPVDGSVSLRDVQLFLKRLRHALRGRRIRYFLAAEYGDAYKRPHYHVVLFGSLEGTHTNPEKGVKYQGCNCVICSAWSHENGPFGNVFIGTVTPASAAYVASYVVKKQSVKTAQGLVGEFATMSRNPGIGVPAIPVFAEAHLDPKSGELRLSDGDVRGVWKSEGRLYPLGPFLAGKLRKAVLGDELLPQAVRAMRAAVQAVERNELGGTGAFLKLRSNVALKSGQKAEAKIRLNRERKGLDEKV